MELPKHRTLIPLFEELRGPRVVVRPYRLEDAEEVFAAIEESRQHTRPWLPWVAAVVTLAACVLGDLGADVYIVMTEFHVGLVDVLSQPQALLEIFKAVFNGLDLAFYALGAFEGWRFGRIAVAKAHGTYTPKPRRQFKL